MRALRLTLGCRSSRLNLTSRTFDDANNDDNVTEKSTPDVNSASSKLSTILSGIWYKQYPWNSVFNKSEEKQSFIFSICDRIVSLCVFSSFFFYLWNKEVKKKKSRHREDHNYIMSKSTQFTFPYEYEQTCAHKYASFNIINHTYRNEYLLNIYF